MAGRTRYEFKLNGGNRDQRIREWIDQQMEEGRDVGELIKNILDEAITGNSSVTGRMMVYQGSSSEFIPGDPDDKVARALANFED